MTSRSFEQAIEFAKRRTRHGLFSWVWLYKSGEVKIETNKTEEETKSARFFAMAAKHIPSKVLEQAIVDSSGDVEFLVGDSDGNK